MTDTAIRPDPDQLLAHIQRQENKRDRGRLKVFLGYAAGVGKTFAMLEAAQRRRAEGMDVVAAYVETHGRPETDALLQGLETSPRRRQPYRGVELLELDLDAVLARRPALALVDELAHTNAPGSRHAKRYQDVLEMLNAGIDVYTTLNIQHLESLNDVVAQITGIVVRETIPDCLLTEADELELIDLPVDELRQRLAAGKVYLPPQARDAMRKFFRTGNLTALRELALRQAAERVDDQMRTYMQTHSIAGPWPASDHLLVCLSPSPLSERLVRTARRLAYQLDAPWSALFVETPETASMSDAARLRVANVLKLAEELGAKSLRLPDRSVADAVVAYARSHNVTKIIIGRTIGSRLTSWLRGSVVDQIVHNSGDIDVYIISSKSGRQPEPAEFPTTRRTRRPFRLLQSIVAVSAATVLGLPLRGLIEPTNLVMPYLLAVVFVALRYGRSPAIVASILSVTAFDLIYVPPYYQFGVADAQYLLTFAALLGVGLVVSALAAQAHEQAMAAQRREVHAAVLYEFARALSGADGIEQVARIVSAYIKQVLSSSATVFVHEGGRLHQLGDPSVPPLSADEAAVAAWSFDHDAPAGRHTATLAGATGYYLPLRTVSGAVGVLGVDLQSRPGPLTVEQERLLMSFASHAALAIERARLADEARRTQLLEETERLQTALLNSISHDLRTPLASITGALSGLRDDSHLLTETVRQDLVRTAYHEADRLNHLLGNLLDMTRLEAGALRLSMEPWDIQDVVGVALDQLSDRLGDRKIELDVPADLPTVPMDVDLITQVLVNLLDNADKYSPADMPIEVKAKIRNGKLSLAVSDRGPGIPSDELALIFDKFYRIHRADGVTGTGLGLSICKGIVEAHGGSISARNRDDGGAEFSFRLSLDPALAGERGDS